MLSACSTGIQGRYVESEFAGASFTELSDVGGSEDVPVDTTFGYRFPKPVDEATVDSDAFFLVDGGEECNPINALESIVSCSYDICVLTLEEMLSEGTLYTICLLAGDGEDGVRYFDGEAFAGLEVDIITEGEREMYAVGGTVTGLSGNLILQNNENDNLIISEDGDFEFLTLLDDGDEYLVTVFSQPETQTCSVAERSGIINGSDITGVAVTCSVNSYTVGGSVSGLAGRVVIQNNGADDLSISEDGDFVFATEVADGSTYEVVVSTQPVSEICSITGGSGTLDGADIYDVSVECSDAGFLDLSFNGLGFALYDDGSGDTGRSITTDSSGRILVSGTYGSDMALWRYNSDGTIDTTFDGDGIVISSNVAGGSNTDVGSAVTTDANGKIVVTGYSHNDVSSFSMVIWRYNENGTLDTTFNGTGYVVASDGEGEHLAGYDVAIDSSGRIVIVGSYYDHSGYFRYMALWRYNSDGTIDATFGEDGWVFGDAYYGSSLVFDSSGRILVAGSIYTGANRDMIILRYNEDGTLDTTFDDDGYVVQDNAGGENFIDEGRGLALDSEGNIIVAGYSYNGDDYDMVVWKFDVDGTIDTSFGNNGYSVQHNAAGGDGDDRAWAVVLDSENNILIAGESANVSNQDMVVWRFDSGGVLDSTFYGDGYVVYGNTAGGDSADYAISLNLDSEEKILVTGVTVNGDGNYDMPIWRLLP